ncbi:Aste57867_24368 [Aphanomyces stellatus]|uniref:Aste57867_24368 protein n=1 Tax=Aphanomyces stellatus TaxID=120398 RepID=A0A485LRC2_9STRA|nr:hypothetical protein As57867_024292 [Aphanomyces stellatus]VFU01008.1 Aste57867_24368 [Aphanomyces stellatus]
MDDSRLRSQNALTSAVLSRIAIPKLASIRLPKTQRSPRKSRGDAVLSMEATDARLRSNRTPRASRLSKAWDAIRPSSPLVTVSTQEKAIEVDLAATYIQKWYRARRDVRFHKLTVTLLALLKQLDRDMILFWKLLHEGLTVTKYTYSGKAKSRRIVCLSPDCERLILGKPVTNSVRGLFRPSQRLLPTEKGIYLRDIADIRAGVATYTLSHSPLLPSADKCFAILGSERTFSLELPSRAARDQAVNRFRVIMDVLQGPNCVLASRQWKTPDMPTGISAEKLDCVYAFLLAGLHVRYVNAHGGLADGVLFVDLATKRLLCLDAKRQYPSPCTKGGLALDDIAEIRKGVNTHGFSQMRLPTSPPPPIPEARQNDICDEAT